MTRAVLSLRHRVWPEGTGFIAGLAPEEDPDDAPLEPDYDAFEPVLWPALAGRIPAFEAPKLERAWAGYYEMNVFAARAERDRVVL